MRKLRECYFTVQSAFALAKVGRKHLDLPYFFKEKEVVVKKLFFGFSLVLLLCVACAGFEKIRILDPMDSYLGMIRVPGEVLSTKLEIQVYSDEYSYELWLDLREVLGPGGSSLDELLDEFWIKVEYIEEVVDITGKTKYEKKAEIVRFERGREDIFLHRSLQPTISGGYHYEITFIYKNSLTERFGRYTFRNLEFNLRETVWGKVVYTRTPFTLFFDILPYISFSGTHYSVVLGKEENGRAFLVPYGVALSNGQEKMDYTVRDVEVIEIFSVDENTFWKETPEGLVKIVERTAYFNPEEYLENERIRTENPTVSTFTYYVEPEEYLVHKKEMVLVWRK